MLVPHPAKEAPMPQILIVTDNSDNAARTVVYQERIAPADFESAHFTGQLAERVGWAVSDADKIEQSDGEGEVKSLDRAAA
jgi:hypothetical protein